MFHFREGTLAQDLEQLELEHKLEPNLVLPTADGPTRDGGEAEPVRDREREEDARRDQSRQYQHQ